MITKRFNQDLLFFIIVSILALLGAGYGIIQLPEVYAERDKTFDLKRISDFTELKREIDYYADQYGTLPESLQTVQDEQLSYYGEDFSYGSEYTIPLNDPQTGTPYNYAKMTQTTYQLCATFATDTTQKSPRYMETYSLYEDSPAFDIHPKGYHCFTLENSWNSYDWDEAGDDEYTYPPLPTPTLVCLGGGCPTAMPSNEAPSIRAEVAPVYQE